MDIHRYRQLPIRDISLAPGLFKDRFSLNHAYVKSLNSPNLLQNSLLEAGYRELPNLRHTWPEETGRGDDLHWGWETPTCQLRGHFPGHWLSARGR